MNTRTRALAWGTAAALWLVAGIALASPAEAGRLLPPVKKLLEGMDPISEAEATELDRSGCIYQRFPPAGKNAHRSQHRRTKEL